MTNPPADGAGDPSMEDILASIRRILNEDEAAPAAHPDGAPGPGVDQRDPAPPVYEAKAAPSPDHVPLPSMQHADAEDVLMLDPATMVPDVPPPSSTVEPPQPLPAVAAPGPDRVLEPSAPVLPGAGLIAAKTEDAAAASVGSLLRTLSAERTTQVHRNGPTIEDLVREELRPLLATWLDAHLPPLVERLVRAEIERVTGRAGP